MSSASRMPAATANGSGRDEREVFDERRCRTIVVIEHPSIPAKPCTKCELVKPLDDFWRMRRHRTGYDSWCKACRRAARIEWEARPGVQARRREYMKAYRSRSDVKDRQRVVAADRYAKQRSDPEYVEWWNARARRYKLKARLGLTEAELTNLMQSQRGRCAICRAPFTKAPNIDHDHKSNVLRGLLCNPCNTGIGLLGHSVPTLRAAIRYLQRAALNRELPTP